MALLKKLDALWLHSDCPKRFKLLALDAVIRAKLLYGLESAQLNASVVDHLNAFQLKGQRNILRLDTTYVNRSNSNARVLEFANAHVTNQAGQGRIKLLSEVYKHRTMILLQQ
eukprot:4079842-Pyramimonas_sp.AAC.1